MSTTALISAIPSASPHSLPVGVGLYRPASPQPTSDTFVSVSSDNIKVQYLQFMGYMKTPQYRSNLQQLLEQEKVKGSDPIAFGLASAASQAASFITSL